MEKEEPVYSSNEDIIGGLKSAASRGEDLKQSMMSFYNAGYSKEEIEDAARKYLMAKTELKKDTPSFKKVDKKLEDKNKEEKEKAKKNINLNLESINSLKTAETISSGADIKKENKRNIFQIFKPKQAKVSEYDPLKKKKNETITLILVFLLIFLVAVLGVVFLFKNELINFFNKLLG